MLKYGLNPTFVASNNCLELFFLHFCHVAFFNNSGICKRKQGGIEFENGQLIFSYCSFVLKCPQKAHVLMAGSPANGTGGMLQLVSPTWRYI